MEKNMIFGIPEMPPKILLWVKKNFLITLRNGIFSGYLYFIKVIYVFPLLVSWIVKIKMDYKGVGRILHHWWTREIDKNAPDNQVGHIFSTIYIYTCLFVIELLFDPEVTANLYCSFAYPYWEGCVICSNFWVVYITIQERVTILIWYGDFRRKKQRRKILKREKGNK